MSHDVTSDGLLGVSLKHGCSINLCYNLVSDYDSHTKLQGWAEKEE